MKKLLGLTLLILVSCTPKDDKTTSKIEVLESNNYSLTIDNSFWSEITDKSERDGFLQTMKKMVQVHSLSHKPWIVKKGLGNEILLASIWYSENINQEVSLKPVVNAIREQLNYSWDSIQEGNWEGLQGYSLQVLVENVQAMKYFFQFLAAPILSIDLFVPESLGSLNREKYEDLLASVSYLF